MERLADIVVLAHIVDPELPMSFRKLLCFCCGFVEESTVSLLNDLGIRGQNHRHTVKNMSLAAVSQDK